MAMKGSEQTFWAHLDDLRGVVVRIMVAIIIFASIAFVLKDQLFAIIFAAQDSDFVTYRLLGSVSSLSSFMGGGAPLEEFSAQIINTQLTEQFTTHVSVAMWCGFIVVFPYILFELFRFVSPALYSHERRYASGVILWGYIMFLIGVLLSYFLLFPLTFRFLASYQVSSSVVNMISLSSYIGTLTMLCLMVGIIFELPILCWLFAKLGLISAEFMRRYRRHAVVILIFVAAIITPTADIITLLLVALPIYLLYEASIVIVGRVNRPLAKE